MRRLTLGDTTLGPLSVINHADARGLLCHPTKTQRTGTRHEPIWRRTTETDTPVLAAAALAGRPRPVRHRPAKLMKSGEGELRLALDRTARAMRQPIALPQVAPHHNQPTLPGPDILEHAIRGITLAAPTKQP